MVIRAAISVADCLDFSSGTAGYGALILGPSEPAVLNTWVRLF